MDSPKSPTIDLDRLVIHDFSSIESETFKKEIVIPYFKDIYRDLASRSDKKSSGINKVTIIDYCQLPGILAERFFSLLDDNNDNYIDLKEFVYVLFKIYYSDFDEQVKLVFDIYDFDKDGYITKEDVRIILSYIPVLRDREVEEKDREGTFSQGGGGHDEYFTRVRIQEEIAELLDIAFKDKDKIDLKEFQKINETTSSDMLVTVLGLLRDKLPCSENFYHFQEDFFKQKKEENFSDMSSQTTESRVKSIPSPTVLKSLSPLARQASNREGMSSGAMSQLRKIAKQDSGKDIKGINEDDIAFDKFKSNKKRKDGEAEIAKVDDVDSPTIRGDMVRLANKNSDPKSMLGKNRAKNIFASPTTFLGSTATSKEDCESPGLTKEPIEYEGEMMRKAKENKLK